MKNAVITILIIALLCFTPSIAILRPDTTIKHYNNLNESVKAVLGSVLDHIERINFSDSSDDDGQTDDADDAYNLKGLFSEPEEKIKSPPKLEDLFNEAFGQDNRFFEGLMEMVAGSLERLHDHANKFIDVNRNKTEDVEGLKEDVLEDFKDFQGLITNILDNILDESVKIDDEQYIVSDKDVNKPISNETKKGESEKKEISENEGNDEESKEKLKNGLKTISFIKNRLGKKNLEHIRNEKVLKRQNALKESDFERIFKEEKEKSLLDDIYV